MRVLVVGASSGIGAAVVRALGARGHQVVAIARREQRLADLAEQAGEGVHPQAHDVTDLDAVPAAFEAAVATLGGLDALVYTAGVMPRIGPDDFDTAVDATTVAVNLTGAIAWCNEAAKRFRRAEGGTIVGIGSVAGDRGRRGNTVYGATKAGLHAYLESLRNRLAPDGVSVITIKPGPVATEMTEGLDGLPLLIEADEAAQRIVDRLGRGSATVYVPGTWRPIMAAIKAIPSALFRRMDI